MEKHFQMELLDPAKLIKINNLQPISNPIFFERPGVPTDNGLLSNSIFGITTFERANTFAYIDLHDWFIHPLIYKVWSRMDKRIREIIHGTGKYRIDSHGDLIKDEENGKTGISFLKRNIDNLKIKYTGSDSNVEHRKFIMDNKDVMFIHQYIIIPAYYRDVNTSENGGRIGVGEINKLYDSLLIAIRAMSEAEDYGISMSNATKGRIQEIILSIYDWFGAPPNISGKKGTLRRSILSKTSDYATRLVMCAPELMVETVDDMQVDLDHSAIPLAAVCTALKPFIIFAVRRFFENEFSGISVYPYKSKTGDIKYVHVKDPLIEFSDEKISREMERFIKGTTNRFIPIKVPNDEGKNIYMRFKGRGVSAQNAETPGKNNMAALIMNRRLTWVDIFYIAAVESAKGKCAIITRYPQDSYFNLITTKIVVNSTVETEPIYLNNELYSHYPKIRESDMGRQSSSSFIDVMQISNSHLKGLCGDYDGDTVTIRIAFTKEANEELAKQIESNSSVIGIGGNCIKMGSNEAVQSLYNLTLILPETKVTDPVF